MRAHGCRDRSAHLGCPDAADLEVAKSRQLWSPTRADRYGVSRPAALQALRQERLDTAESLAAASLRRWEGVSQSSRTQPSNDAKDLSRMALVSA